MHSILIIHFYFGILPTTFEFFIESCKDNTSVDFLIVTDCNIKIESPNIIVHKTSIQEIGLMIEARFGFRPCLIRAHKLCDFKPIWGLIMEEYSRDYDFWGFCDSDLVFGDIRKFLTDDILEKYDHLLGMGHFQLQRTTDPKYVEVLKSARGVGANAYYERNFDASKFLDNDNGPKLEEVLQSESNYIFDELPYGVASQYFKMFPDKFWSGYSQNGRCFDDVDPNPLYFRDIYNFYDGYLTTSYKQLSYLFPFFKRIPSENSDIDSVIYEKTFDGLYRIGYNDNGEMVRTACLYAHFLHRKLKIQSKKRHEYLIVPNKFIDGEPVSYEKFMSWINNPILGIERKITNGKKQIGRVKTLWKKIFYKKNRDLSL